MRLDAIQYQCDKCGTVNDMTHVAIAIGRCACYKCGHHNDFHPKSTKVRQWHGLPPFVESEGPVK